MNILNCADNLIQELVFYGKEDSKKKKGDNEVAISVSVKNGKKTVRTGKDAKKDLNKQMKDINSTRKDMLDSWMKHFKNLGTFDWDKDFFK